MDHYIYGIIPGATLRSWWVTACQCRVDYRKPLPRCKCWALQPLRPLRPLRALRARWALRALQPLRALRELQPLRALRAVRAVRARAINPGHRESLGSHGAS